MASDNPSGLAPKEDADDNIQQHVWDAHAAQQAQMSQTSWSQWPQQNSGQRPVMTWDVFNVVEPQHVEQYLASPLHAGFPDGSYLEPQDFANRAHTEMPTTFSSIEHSIIHQPAQLSSQTLTSQARFKRPERETAPESTRQQPPGASSGGKGRPNNRKGKVPVSHASSSSKETSTETPARTGRPDASTESTLPSEGDIATPLLKEEDDSPDTRESESTKDTLLERNRVAASKFRHRKRDETKDLVADEKDLEQIHAQLAQCHSELKTEVLRLKGLLLQHAHCDCVMIREYIRRESERILREAGREGNGASNEWPIDMNDVHAHTGYSDFR